MFPASAHQPSDAAGIIALEIELERLTAQHNKLPRAELSAGYETLFSCIKVSTSSQNYQKCIFIKAKALGRALYLVMIMIKKISLHPIFISLIRC